MDSVTLGGLPVTGQTFGEATSLSKPTSTFFGGNIVGILGLGYASISEPSGIPTIIDNLQAQGKIDAYLFSFYLRRDNVSNAGGELTIGGMNSAYYTTDPFVWAAVTTKTYWQVRMDKMQLLWSDDSLTYCGSGCEAIIDSGTSLCYVPKSVLIWIRSMVCMPWVVIRC